LADGVIVVDKPRGPTSHDVVATLRKKLATARIGHAGTLDPMATGVLVVAVGQATKLVSYLTAADKEYEATIALGAATDTLDADGRETARADIPGDWRVRLDEAIAAERARTEQEPPAFSAIHVDGVRAHTHARRGDAPVLEPRAVAVVSLEVAAVRESALDVRLVVSKGYYVRALARDLAARLGTLGHLSALRRSRSGAFALAEAPALASTDATTSLIPLAQIAARTLPVVTLTTDGVAHARSGRRVPPTDMSDTSAGERAWLAADGALVAIGRVDDGAGRVVRGFS
jgi:tRNA pseudouridine55 synthase